MQKIRIAYVIDTILSDTAGTEKQLLQILQRLDRGLFDPVLICLWESAWMKRNVIPCETQVLGYRGFLELGFPRLVHDLGRLIKQGNIQVVHTFFEDSIFVGLLGALLSRIRPVLLSSRRDIGLGPSRPWYHRFYRLILPYVDRYFDGIVANAQSIKAFVIEHERVSSEKVKVIRNGIEVPLGLEPEPELFKRHPADLWIGMAASLTPVKHVDMFLRGLANFKKCRPEISFGAVIMGEGPLKEQLVQAVSSLGLNGQVHFLGAIRNVVAYLQRCDMGVLTSDREGLSNAVLEYMANGLPVIATAVGGNVELVDDDNGICVPPGDASRLGEAITRLSFDPFLRAKMGSCSLDKVRRHYSWTRTMHELESYYSDLLPKKRVLPVALGSAPSLPPT